jgi:hypothetical protein
MKDDSRTEIRKKAERAMVIAAMGGAVLSGEDPEVQGAALAEMMVTFIRGHRIVGDSSCEHDMHETILTHWIKTVRELLLIHGRPCGGAQ